MGLDFFSPSVESYGNTRILKNYVLIKFGLNRRHMGSKYFTPPNMHASWKWQEWASLPYPSDTLWHRQLSYWGQVGIHKSQGTEQANVVRIDYTNQEWYRNKFHRYAIIAQETKPLMPEIDAVSYSPLNTPWHPWTNNRPRM